MRQLSRKTALVLSALSAISTSAFQVPIQAAPPERPTLNHTADPRPNILPDSLYNHHVPYRLQYNRPTYHVGKALYYVVSPTSQEALAWKENLDAGRYDGHHCPPMYKSYMYPKPWEILNTGPRPNFASISAVPVTVQPLPVVPVPMIPINPVPADKPSAEVEKVEAQRQ